MVNKKIVALFASSTLLLIPFTAFARPGVVDIDTAISGILNIISILFGVFAVIMFLYAGFLFLSANGEPSKVSQAQQALLWGTVGVVVGLLAFGAVEAISGALFGGAATST